MTDHWCPHFLVRNQLVAAQLCFCDYTLTLPYHIKKVSSKYNVTLHKLRQKVGRCLTCHSRRSTWGASPRCISSTLVFLLGGHGRCRWTRSLRLTRTPTWRWSGRHSKPLAYLRRGAMEWRPLFSFFQALSGCVDLEVQTVMSEMATEGWSTFYYPLSTY